MLNGESLLFLQGRMQARIVLPAGTDHPILISI
jgi:hypothetical protein